MDAARPAAGAAHPLLELGDYSPDMLPSLLGALNRNGPADPLVASQGGDVLPLHQRPGRHPKGLAQIGRQAMGHPARNLLH